jgi:DNA-binding MarR family transcriptional regulator
VSFRIFFFPNFPSIKAAPAPTTMITSESIGLAPSHAYLLLLILEEPGMQPGCIASHLQLSPSTITRLIEKLEEKKLVVRTTEGKLTNVYPTPKAKELLPQMKNCGQQFYKSCVDDLGKEENSKIVSALRSVADKLGD